MNTVTIEKADLLKTVRENRDKHEAEHATARAGYVEKLEKELRRLADKLADGKHVGRERIMQLMRDLPEPESHVDDYDRVIRMLEMSVDSQVEITANDFDQFVMDEWGWKGAFAATNSRYV